MNWGTPDSVVAVAVIVELTATAEGVIVEPLEVREVNITQSSWRKFQARATF